MVETILQNPILTKFVYPFLLVFFILFAVLEKTKILGDNQKQINALVSFVIGLIFVAAVFPKIIVGNMVLFLTLAIVIVFVVMMLWGFVSGGGDLLKLEKAPDGLKWTLGIVVVLAVVVAVFWAAGIDTGFLGNLFNSEWSDKFWTNFFFIVVVAVALAVAVGKKATGGDKP